jgi:hypothetical protein
MSVRRPSALFCSRLGHFSNENLKLVPKIKAALFCPDHLKSIKYTKYLFHYATSRKVAGFIPDGVIEFFIDVILLVALLPWDRLSLYQK